MAKVDFRTRIARSRQRATGHPAWPYVAPFATYLLLIGLSPMEPRLSILLRVVLCSVVLLSCSRSLLDFRARHIGGSLLLGAVVFGIWIGPDVLWPAYRQHWLFCNVILGAPHSTLPVAVRADRAFLLLRAASSVIIVPIVEELFWRAWVMRRLVSVDFQKVPLGTYSSQSFWLTAVLFAIEHGPYWEVGLLAGVAYNLWVVRTKNIADCILAHACTNGLLALYVVVAGKWEYWL